jgi:hypothetical protein
VSGPKAPHPCGSEPTAAGIKAYVCGCNVGVSATDSGTTIVPADVAAKTGTPSRLEPKMNMSLSFAPLVALLAGILILVVPRLLNYSVAIYLIVIGLLGLFGGSFHLK